MGVGRSRQSWGGGCSSSEGFWLIELDDEFEAIGERGSGWEEGER